MKLELNLLGVPQIFRAGEPLAPLRGHKAWGILAYLVLSPDRVNRQQLAALLFEDAEDPMATLRWNLSELRGALGHNNLRGNPIAFHRDDIGTIDVDVLMHGHWSQALALGEIGDDLLAGINFSASPSFAVWLQMQRRRLHATSGAVLREAALAKLATGEVGAASDLAARLVSLDPLDENHQVLLVRCLSAAGDGVGAARQAAACRTLFARELGVQPGPALSAALHTSTATPTVRPTAGRAAALAQIEAGEAAIGAGVLDAGLQCLRRAIADADMIGDPVLCTRARLSLGSALVHSARGSDEEGAAALHEALTVGTDVSPALAAAACRELGYIEFLRGQYARATAWLDRATPLAGSDPAEQARIATVHGSILSDTAYYKDAIARLQEALELARSIDDTKQRIYVLSMIGRAHVLRGEDDAAETALADSVALARHSWTAVLPWPLSFQAEVDLLRGRTDLAADRLEHAFALACQLGDPCWEGIAGRGLGKIAMLRGQVERAQGLLLDALRRCVRLPDGYLWGKAFTLDALTGLAVAQRMPGAAGWLEELTSLAGNAGMREFVARAHGYRGQLGDRTSAAAARLLAAEIDNPLLTAIKTTPSA